jgi:hypothetical protein
MGRIRLRKVLGESPNSFVGEALGRGDFQSLWLGDRQEAEEAPPTHPVFVQRPLGEPSCDAVAERSSSSSSDCHMILSVSANWKR